MRNAAVLKFFMFAVLGSLAAVPAGYSASSEGYRILEEIPVQHAGRIKPLQSFAKETVLYMTGKTKFAGMEPVQLVWEWIAEPEAWYTKPLIPVTRHALREEFKVMLVEGRLSPEIALNHAPFIQSVQEASAKQARKDTLSPDDKQRLEIYEKAAFFKTLGQGQTPGLIPHPSDPRAAWLPIESMISEEGRNVIRQFFPEEKVTGAGEALVLLLDEIRKPGSEDVPVETAARFTRTLDALFLSREVALDRKLIAMEVQYDHLQPFSRAAILYFTALLLSILSFLLLTGTNRFFQTGARFLSSAALIVFAGAFLLHAYGFFLRCQIAGRPPVTNMYESMIWVSWAVAFFSLVLFAFYRNWMILNTAGFVAGLCLLIAHRFPVALNPAISPLVPVLRSNLWLTVHVLTITLSYGAFALAWGLGHGVLFRYATRPDKKEQLRMLSQYLYRTLQIGVVLLAAGTILGGVWANYSWGRFWGWDPKETWALIALLGYLVVLHSRFSGWTADFGIAVGSILAFLGVIMAWYGVNFVLAAGLHSYGFGGGGLQNVCFAVAADLLIVAWLAFRYKTAQSRARGQAGV